MQINNNRLADFYAPVPVERGRSTSLPVIFDEAGQDKVGLRPERPDNSMVVEAITNSQDSQQARFIRSFISSEHYPESDSERTLTMPQTVRQYQLIDALPTQPPTQRGQFLDEMV